MIRVYSSAVINAPIDKVWDKIKDFNGLASWHPAVKESIIEGDYPNGAIGCVRALHLSAEEGGIVRESLVGYNALEHTIVYDIVSGPMPVKNYVATMRLLPITESDLTLFSWYTETDASEETTEEDLYKLLDQDIYQVGYKSLNEIIASEA